MEDSGEEKLSRRLLMAGALAGLLDSGSVGSLGGTPEAAFGRDLEAPGRCGRWSSHAFCRKSGKGHAKDRKGANEIGDIHAETAPGCSGPK